MCAPTPPDPKQTAAATTGTNVGTAIANTMMGNVNQVTPDGSLNYSQSGTYSWTDPFTGQTYDIPQFTATQTLSPDAQAIHNTNMGTKKNFADIGLNQSGMIESTLSNPVDLSNDAVEGRLFDLGSKRLDPKFARDREGLRTELYNRGIREGSDAWNAEMGRQGQNENDAFNQLLLDGRAQSVQEILTQRNQPINEITALLSGSQVSQPNFVNTKTSTIPTTDVGGLINQNYAQKSANYNDFMGGLFGLGSSLIGLSDRNAKKDIEKRGEIDGLGIYDFRYKGESGPKHTGLMAQEVEKKKPHAVRRMNGLRYVDYGKALG